MARSSVVTDRRERCRLPLRDQSLPPKAHVGKGREFRSLIDNLPSQCESVATWARGFYASNFHGAATCAAPHGIARRFKPDQRQQPFIVTQAPCSRDVTASYAVATAPPVAHTRPPRRRCDGP